MQEKINKIYAEDPSKSEIVIGFLAYLLDSGIDASIETVTNMLRLASEEIDD
jgi:hypothetical protein